MEPRASTYKQGFARSWATMWTLSLIGFALSFWYTTANREIYAAPISLVKDQLLWNAVVGIIMLGVVAAVPSSIMGAVLMMPKGQPGQLAVARTLLSVFVALVAVVVLFFTIMMLSLFVWVTFHDTRTLYEN